MFPDEPVLPQPFREVSLDILLMTEEKFEIENGYNLFWYLAELQKIAQAEDRDWQFTDEEIQHAKIRAAENSKEYDNVLFNNLIEAVVLPENLFV